MVKRKLYPLLDLLGIKRGGLHAFHVASEDEESAAEQSGEIPRPSAPGVENEPEVDPAKLLYPNQEMVAGVGFEPTTSGL
jgi:hypothetical protein